MSVAVGILWLLSAYLVLVHPLFGRRLYQRLKKGSVSRTFVYRRTMVLQWLTTVLIVTVFLFGRIPLRLLGLYNPNGVFLPGGMLGGLLIGISIFILLITGLSAVRFPRLHRKPPNGSNSSGSTHEPPPEKEHGQATEEGLHPSPNEVGDIAVLLPQTRRERFMFAALAVTAGVCEEVLFRGMPVYLLNHQFPNLGPILVLLFTALMFGVAHIYQGWMGVLTSALLGAVFTAIYLSTGALWIPMILHAVIDLRVLLIAGKD